MRSLLLLLVAGCDRGSAPALPCTAEDPVVPVEGFFTDVSEASGIRTDNFATDPPEGMLINDHSRLAFADLDGDGFDDIVMHSLFPNPQNGVPYEHLVFHNLGDGTFEDWSDRSGLRDVQAGFFAFADMDDDGDADAYAGLDLDGYGVFSSQILLNDGTGRFAPLDGSGVEESASVAANAVFADFNNDGNVDLYVGNGGTTYAAPDLLYSGRGDGTFDDDSNLLLGNPSRPSNGTVACDFDDDGDEDVFVSTYGVSVDRGHDVLWQNDGDGEFENVADDKGFAALPTGNYWLASTGYGVDEQDAAADEPYGGNGFGIDCGDVDGNGTLDVLVTAISHPDADVDRTWSDPTALLLNRGADADFAFENAFLERGLEFNEGDVDGALVDFDNDGRLDISLSRDRKYEGGYDDAEQKSWFGLMWRRPDGAFDSLGVNSGINDPDEALFRMKGAQNHAWSDIDHDGDLDLLVGGRDQGGGRPNFLFRNDLGSENAWLGVRIEGDGETVHRDAFGTRVTLAFADGAVLVREKKSSRGMYNSEDTRVLHFGLGGRGCDYVAEIAWPDGTRIALDPQALGVDHIVTVRYPDIVEE